MSVSNPARPVSLPDRNPDPFVKQERPRVVIVTTSALTLRTFFVSQIGYLKLKGFHVHTISSSETGWGFGDENLPTHSVKMPRKISPWSDFLAILKLCRLLRKIQPVLIQTHTPKAGLLGMIAATLTGVKVRVYTVNGLVWINTKGWQRRLLTATEKLSSTLATNIIAVSESMRQIMINERICPSFKIRVLGAGASHGVDTHLFDPKADPGRREAMRARLHIPVEAQIIVFVGRLNQDKGIEELAEAWNELNKKHPELYLVLCGKWEQKSAVRSQVQSELQQSSRVRIISLPPAEMPPLYAAADLCVLPSKREGLPNVALEAGAMERAIVATRIPGCVDVIIDGVTGILVSPDSVTELTVALQRLLEDEALRIQMGQAARARIEKNFTETSVSQKLEAEYRRLLGRTGIFRE
jgi:glycosyltransferase involved in cell wall biosynthesis